MKVPPAPTPEEARIAVKRARKHTAWAAAMGDACVVCGALLEDSDESRTFTPHCSHRYHAACLAAYTESQPPRDPSLCPVCEPTGDEAASIELQFLVASLFIAAWWCLSSA